MAEIIPRDERDLLRRVGEAAQVELRNSVMTWSHTGSLPPAARAEGCYRAVM